MFLAAAVFTVHVVFNNLAAIPTQQVVRDFQDISKIYYPIEINAQPLNVSEAPDPQAFYIVLSNKMLPLNFYDALGAANPPARVAWVFMPKIDSMKGNRNELTELAIAHELGHLLGLWHTVTGIMAPVESSDSPEINLRRLDRSQVNYIEKRSHSAIYLH